MVLNTSLRLCKILKSIQNEWIPKYWRKLHFFNVDLAGDISLRMDTQDIRSSSSHIYYCIVVLKSSAKFTGTHRDRSLFSTCNLQLHWKRDAGIYIFLLVLWNFLGTRLLQKTSCELVLKVEYYEKWWTDILIIIKRYHEVDSSFKKQTLRGIVYIWEPLIESWHWT